MLKFFLVDHLASGQQNLSVLPLGHQKERGKGDKSMGTQAGDYGLARPARLLQDVRSNRHGASKSAVNRLGAYYGI